MRRATKSQPSLGCTSNKAGPGRFIDAAVAAINAYEAIATAPERTPKREILVAWH